MSIFFKGVNTKCNLWIYFVYRSKLHARGKVKKCCYFRFERNEKSVFKIDTFLIQD